ncbi:hypothetical protein BTZ05_03325 [Vibrio parahaemolyticus]|nr:hypothetical protein BTZ05_03325 [Vibrio parahaemolyticus]TOF26363.1 hypothetical protein CGJ27_09820 [Vibrio parahaemolyticus]
MVKTEFQRQLEALGFTRKRPQSNKRESQKKIQQTPQIKSKPVPKKNCDIKPHKKMTTAEAKVILRRYCSQPDRWEEQEFKVAFRVLTGQSNTMTLKEAKNAVGKWYCFESKYYQLEYSIACLLLSGIWFPPRSRLKEGMSKQVKARCERRDLNAGYMDTKVFRN